jgi:hypothetical protein
VRDGGEKYAFKSQKYYDKYINNVDNSEIEIGELRNILIKSALKGNFEAQSHLAFLTY